MLQTSGVQNIAKKRYMKCTLCLGLVGLQHPSELLIAKMSILNELLVLLIITHITTHYYMLKMFLLNGCQKFDRQRVKE